MLSIKGRRLYKRLRLWWVINHVGMVSWSSWHFYEVFSTGTFIVFLVQCEDVNPTSTCCVSVSAITLNSLKSQLSKFRDRSYWSFSRALKINTSFRGVLWDCWSEGIQYFHVYSVVWFDMYILFLWICFFWQ